MKTLEQLRKEKREGSAAAATGYFDYAFKVKKPKSAAQLEALIDEYCSLSSAECTKVAVTGRQLVNQTKVGNVLGHEQTITDVKYIPSTTRLGTSDLIIMKKGLGMYVEVKFSKGDRQSEVQKKFQLRQERFGNPYFIVKTLDEFILLFNNFYKIV